MVLLPKSETAKPEDWLFMETALNRLYNENAAQIKYHQIFFGSDIIINHLLRFIRMVCEPDVFLRVFLKHNTTKVIYFVDFICFDFYRKTYVQDKYYALRKHSTDIGAFLVYVNVTKWN